MFFPNAAVHMGVYMCIPNMHFCVPMSFSVKHQGDKLF